MPLDIFNVNRPTKEAYDVFVKVTEGCSHGRCTYCPFFREPYRRLTTEEIEREVIWARDWCIDEGERPERAFLQAADAMSLSCDTLLKAAEFVFGYMPWVRSIGAYARVDNFRKKTVEDLVKLKDAGYSDIYVGIESGDPFLLRKTGKGYRPKDITEQMQKLDAAEMKWTGNFLNGMGGHLYGDRHARLTGELYKTLKPASVEIMSLTVMPGTKLYRKRAWGRFEEATEVERLIEIRDFISALENDTVIKCANVSNAVKFAGRIPKEKDRLFGIIDKALEEGVNFRRERIRKL